LNSVLQKLELCSTGIGDSGAAAIAESLKVNSGLQELVLGNQVEDSGAAAIAEALKVNSSLQKLHLCENQIGDAGAASIARALMRNASLRQLDLRDNAIGDAGAAAIEESLERSFLGLEQNSNAHFPEILYDGLTRKYPFLYALSDTGFRSFIMNDVPPALWPHALAKVSAYPALIFHLLLQIPWSRTFGVKDPSGSLSK
jgi:hypothetical protein